MRPCPSPLPSPGPPPLFALFLFLLFFFQSPLEVKFDLFNPKEPPGSGTLTPTGTVKLVLSYEKREASLSFRCCRCRCVCVWAALRCIPAPNLRDCLRGSSLGHAMRASGQRPSSLSSPP